MIVRINILKENQSAFESKIWIGKIILLDWKNIMKNTFRIRLERKQRRLHHTIHKSFVSMFFLVQMMVRCILVKNVLFYLEKNIWNIFTSFRRRKVSFSFSTNGYYKNFQIKSEKSEITNRPKIYYRHTFITSKITVKRAFIYSIISTI